MKNHFWEKKALTDLNQKEWESLCDGCGRCCLVQLQDEDTEKLSCTNIACKQLDINNIRCTSYENRSDLVASCLVLSTETIEQTLSFAPLTCAYRLIYEGKPLFDWHPLISGTTDTVIKAGISVLGKVVSEKKVKEVDFDNHIVDCESLKQIPIDMK